MKKLILLIGLVAVMISCGTRSKMEDTTLNGVEKLILTNPDSALLLLGTIDPSKLKGSEGIARFGLLLTAAEDKAGIVHKSAEYMERAVDYYEMHPVSDSLLGVVFYYLGRVQEDLEEPHQALESYFKSKSYFESCNSSYWLGRLYYNIGYLFHQDYDYSHASSFFSLAIDQFSCCNDSLNIAHTLNLIGTNHLLQGEPEQALVALEKAYDYYNEVGNTEGVLSTVLSISNIYLDDWGDVWMAESTIKQAFANYGVTEIPLGHYLLLGQIEARKGDFEKAIRLLEAYTKLDVNLELEDRAGITYLISEYYHSLGKDTPAYKYLDEYIAIKDSINEAALLRVLREVEERHRKQELQNEYNAYRKSITYRVIIGALALCIVISLLIVEVNKRRQRNLRLQADLDGLRSQMSEFDDLKHRLSVVLNKQIEKETRLREVLTNKMLHVQKIVDYLFLYENNSDEFKKKIRTAVVQAEKDAYFGELHEIVNEKYYGIVDHLKSMYPALTDDELNLCGLVCFGFTNTQISILFGYTNSNSIFNKRHKVRMKMGLCPNYESLEAYITHLVNELKQQDTK